MKNTVSLLSLCAALIVFNTPVIASADLKEEDNVGGITAGVESVKLEKDSNNGDNSTSVITEDDKNEVVKAAGNGKLTLEDGKELIEAGKDAIGALSDGIQSEDLGVFTDAGKTVVGVASDVAANVGNIPGVVTGGFSKITGIFGGGDDDENEETVVAAANSEKDE